MGGPRPPARVVRCRLCRILLRSTSIRSVSARAGVPAHVILTQSGAQTEFWCTESPWLVTVDSRQG